MDPETKLQIASVKDVPQSVLVIKTQSRSYVKTEAKQTRMNLLKVSSFVLAFAMFGFFIFLSAQFMIQDKQTTVGANSNVNVDAPRILDSSVDTSVNATVDPAVDSNVESNGEPTVDANSETNVDPSVDESVASDIDTTVDENPASDADPSDTPDDLNETPVVTPIVLQTISEARSYFDDKEEENLLLLSATWTDSYIALTFEATSTEVHLTLSIVSTFSLNKDTWKAYITYMDETRQIIPYLGEELEIDSSNVVVDPYSNCPLTARITFETKVPGKVRLTIVGRDAESHDLVHQFNGLETNHVIPVLGLYEGHNNVVRVAFTDSKGNVRATKELNIQTAALTELEAADNKLTIKQKSTLSKPLFISVKGTVYDEQGYIRWYRPNFALLYYVGPNLIATATNVQITLTFYNWLGEQLLQLDIPEGIHHEIVEKVPGGNILIGSGLKHLYEEVIHEIDRKTGKIVKTWDFTNYLDSKRPIRNSNRPYKAYDWLHINSIAYDPKDNTILISARNQCLVSKIGYDDGTVKYVISDHSDWVAPYTDYLLTPTNFNTTLHEDQDWTRFQHTAVPVANGNVLIYDNGGMRPGFTNNPATEIFNLTGVNYASVYNPIPSGYARAVEYSVDSESKTITKVWEHTDFPTLMTTIVGSVKLIDSDTIVIGYGELGAVTVVKKSTNEKLFHAQATKQFYRATPVDLYEGY